MRSNFRRRFLKNSLGIVALGSFSFKASFVDSKSSQKVVVKVEVMEELLFQNILKSGASISM